MPINFSSWWSRGPDSNNDLGFTVLILFLSAAASPGLMSEVHLSPRTLRSGCLLGELSCPGSIQVVQSGVPCAQES